MKARGLFLLSAAIVLVAFFAYGRTIRTYYELSATLHAMGGVEIEVKGYDTNPQTFKKAFEEIKQRLIVLEDRMSRFKAGSDITRINELGSTAPVPVDPATYQILQTAARISEGSGGAFDVSILPVIQLWKQASKANQFPAPERIAATRAKVSYQGILLDQGAVRISPGMG
ncbi:MAG: FAD:protein FMN transferase, partial [Holophaga sp.]|nr:FAD:protein FMN transferase [Holophaga sp.]